MRALAMTVLFACSCGRIRFDDHDDAAVVGDVPIADGTQASTCATVTGVLMCDGFEDTLGQWEALAQTNGVVSIDGTRAYRGTHSLHGAGVAAPSTEEVDAWVTDQTVLAAMPPRIFVRMFVYAPAPPPGDQLAIIGIGQPVPPYLGIVLDYSDLSGLPQFYNATSGTATYTESATALPFGRWVCVEVQYDIAASNGALHAFIDDIERTDLAVTQQTQSSPPIGNINVGLFLPYAGVVHQAYDLWIDEVIVSTNRIGCAL